MSKVFIAGGGAAGMMTGIFAARNGHEVHIYEKNEKLGKKLFITGKGRCNITNAGDMDTLFASVISNPKFLYSGFYSFTNEQVLDFFKELGIKIKIERGNRVFPESDHSSDVIGAMTRELKRLHVEIHLHSEVKEICTENGKFQSILLSDGKKVSADACIIATGGISYPSTGSTGDGYRFARNAGHSVTELFPSLVPMEVKEPYIMELQGLSLRNVNVAIYDGTKRIYEEFGEMLFTHYGVSGPIIISASSLIGPVLNEKNLRLTIDLKPALSMEQLDQRVLRDFGENRNKQFKNAVDKLFPGKLKPVMLELSQIDPDKKVHEISREERLKFVTLIKNLEMTLTGLRGFKEAIITKGGVDVKQIDPGTMESKLVRGLYFTGEVLDLDALTGGFNLQIAWSTAYLAGNAV
ncbi:MAG: NAD(P)/FAD-dependent oxidoreductase [Ruminococcus sp.]|nr:NAD(P)/FAD-dependent oxidoreductase [Ruminococcus sp.]